MKLLLVAVLFFALQVRAEDIQSFQISIKDHKFSQNLITVKANEKFKLTIQNEDASSEEFESKTMAIEKFMGPKKSITVILGPLKPGTYEFYGEFHQSTAKGQVVAK